MREEKEKPCWCGDGCPSERVCCGDKKILEESAKEMYDEHVRRNKIKGHSIHADGSCNMGCC